MKFYKNFLLKRTLRIVYNKPTLNLDELVELNMSHVRNIALIPSGSAPGNFGINS